MANFNLGQLEINKKILLVNDKNFFEGTIIKLYENYMGVQIPTDQANFKIINKNQSIEFLLVYDEEAYRCRSKVLGCISEDRSQLVLLEQPEIINKIERRQNKRVQTFMDIEYFLMPEDIQLTDDIPPTIFGQMKKTVSVDVSDSGVALITYEIIREGRIVVVSFELEKKMTIICRVVRSEINDKGENYKTALKFLNVYDEK